MLASYGNEAPPVHFENFYGLKSDYERTRTELPTGVFEHDFNEVFTLRNLTRYGVTSRDSIITSPRFLNATLLPRVLNRQLQSQDQTDTILANQADLTSKFALFKMDHALVTGVEYDNKTSKHYARGVVTNGTFIGGATARMAPPADLFNPTADVERRPGPARRFWLPVRPTAAGNWPVSQLEGCKEGRLGV